MIDWYYSFRLLPTALPGCLQLHTGDRPPNFVHVEGSQWDRLTRTGAHSPSQRDEAPMNVLWIALSVGVVGALIAAVGWKQAHRLSDLGSVSDQWIAEHRSQTQNLPR